MKIVLTIEESNRILELIQELITTNEENPCKNCEPKTANCFGGCNLEEIYKKRINVINEDPLMQQPIINEYVYAMLRQHELKKEFNELQEKINETYNIEKNFIKSIIVDEL